MSIRDLARLLIRFNAAWICFYAVIDATYLGPYLRIYHTAAARHFENGPELQNLMAAVFRIALHLVVGATLFKFTDRVIDLFVGRFEARGGESPRDREHWEESP